MDGQETPLGSSDPVSGRVGTKKGSLKSLATRAIL